MLDLFFVGKKNKVSHRKGGEKEPQEVKKTKGASLSHQFKTWKEWTQSKTKQKNYSHIRSFSNTIFVTQQVVMESSTSSTANNFSALILQVKLRHQWLAFTDTSNV